LRKVTSLALLFALATGSAFAATPSVADLDAHARATGNRKDIAVSVGDNLFRQRWPAQVMQVAANEMGTHLVLGLRISGVHFHRPLSRDEFYSEIAALVSECFSAAPQAEEVDVWTTVPLDVGKGVVVAGDLAKPTSRTVFTLSARRGETAADLASRLRGGGDVFVDEEWARTAFKSST
jgi:predicted amino acid dehydrogenase